MTTSHLVIRKYSNFIFFVVTALVIFELKNKMFTEVPEKQTQHTDQQTEKTESVAQPNLPKCEMTGLTSVKEFYQYFEERKNLCKKTVRIGKNDGEKIVCLDEGYQIVPGKCHILSFGISNEWSFDDALGEKGCKVYSFDPTMDVEDHQRSKNVRFFKLGIGNIQGKRVVGMGKDFRELQVDRYENILERLGLTATPIDYLKMDTELSELDFFQDVFRNSPHLIRNVKQMGMELHHGKLGEGLDLRTPVGRRGPLGPTSALQLFWQYFQELKCHGFGILHVTRKGPWTEILWGRNTLNGTT